MKPTQGQMARGMGGGYGIELMDTQPKSSDGSPSSSPHVEVGLRLVRLAGSGSGRPRVVACYVKA
jgi:hypothetical protein